MSRPLLCWRQWFNLKTGCLLIYQEDLHLLFISKIFQVSSFHTCIQTCKVSCFWLEFHPFQHYAMEWEKQKKIPPFSSSFIYMYVIMKKIFFNIFFSHISLQSPIRSSQSARIWLLCGKLTIINGVQEVCFCHQGVRFPFPLLHNNSQITSYFFHTCIV